ncbi:MAG: hypothetical protein K2N61_03955 [Lachnospiraceae bacterium]|nr:hypothetical protein [Lachnospiraceae bacterium]
MDYFSESQNEIRRMEMLKAVLPYIPVSMQKFLNIYMGFSELFNAINMIRNGPILYTDSIIDKSKLGNTDELLGVLRGFCSPKENELIDMFFNMSKVMNMYDNYKDIFSMFQMPQGSDEEKKQENYTSNTNADYSNQETENQKNNSPFSQMNPMAMMNMMNQFKGSKEIDDIFNNFLKQ